jgi:hypothetical protein
MLTDCMHRGSEEFGVADVLMVRRLPFRLSRKQVAGLIGLRDDDSVGVLVERGLLHPLGNPPKGAPLWFATAGVLKLANNLNWLTKATEVLRENVRAKNQKAKPPVSHECVRRRSDQLNNGAGV